MSLFEFGTFAFDPDRLRLFQHGEPRHLRPKTALLLRLLLERRGEIVSKREIAVAVWRSPVVTDQSLFQAVSELRKTLATAGEAVLTHPNLGYEWAAPVSIAAPRAAARGRGWRQLPSAALAATVVLVLAVTAGHPSRMSAQPAGDTAGPAHVASMSPAMRAFELGLQRLGAGQADAAERLFAIAAQENPGFREASLMVAEAVLVQGRYAEAQQHASALLLAAQAERDSQQAYLVAAAMDLLSRISEQAGNTGQAIGWSLSALEQAREHDFACTAAENSDRLQQLIVAAGRAPAKESDPGHHASAAHTASADGVAMTGLQHCQEIGAAPGPDRPALGNWPRYLSARTCPKPQDQLRAVAV